MKPGCLVYRPYGDKASLALLRSPGGVLPAATWSAGLEEVGDTLPDQVGLGVCVVTHGGVHLADGRLGASAHPLRQSISEVPVGAGAGSGPGSQGSC